jgi:dolichyl-phosphate beta-glucosyltransferase
METLSLILPAYNEERRLPRTFGLIQRAIQEGVFQGCQLQEILVVDDGSSDRTALMGLEARSVLPQIRVLEVLPNQGKGNAIHTGLRASQSTWCLVADADSSTPWDQFQKLWTHTHRSSPPTPIAIGSRDLPESDIRTSQSWVRENMGKTFNWLVRMITGLPFHDTQCGFKLIHRPSIQSFLPKLIVKRFAWDVEFLMFARSANLSIAEVPVAWEHQDESRVNPVKDSLEMLMRVIQLRFRILFQQWK